MVSVTRKVCLLGEFSVGKTSIARRYVTGTFTPDYHATLGVNIYKFADAWTSDEGQDIEANLLIWDIEGGELAPGLRESYITGAAGALVVGDISRAVTLEAMAGHAQMFATEAPGRPLAFAFNKADLTAATETDGIEQALAERFDAPQRRVSAATGDQIIDLFRSLTERIVRIGV